MAMNLRLTDEETTALRECAKREHRSMQEVARTAIVEYAARRSQHRAELLDRIVTERADLLHRLSDA